ncbi:MAG: MerR family transcriptional regulator [Deltaproteobacteria bacterium]|nr:MerR family transcriptional regulator [Deltaproteobacteria bacterium]
MSKVIFFLKDFNQLAEALSNRFATSFQDKNKSSKATPKHIESLPKLCFSTTTIISKSNRNRKTANYLSLLEVCKILGIDRKTYRRHEGTLFPIAQKDPTTGFRIFTKHQANQLEALWSKRAEFFSKNRHYHYHKTKNFYSLFEACKLIGISRKTFRKYEGVLFPVIWRDNKGGRRLFTEKDIEQIRKTWEDHKKGK